MAIILTSQLKSINDNVVHRYATLWRLQRSDGVIFRFTNHNTNITFRNSLYLSSLGFDASATQRQSGFNESNKESAGFVVPEGESGITEDDLRGGRYRQAKVVEYLIDWQYPWINELCKTKYTISNIAFYDQAWRFELVGQTKLLSLPTGKTYTRNCRHVLGSQHHYTTGPLAADLAMFEPRCGVDLTDAQYRAETTVESITNPRTSFDVVASLGSENNYFRFGVLFFTSGANAGLKFDIGSSTTAGTVTTYVEMPFNVEVDDEVILTVGCDKTITTCNTKFTNRTNFGGFPDIPGTDRAVFIPDNKI